MRCAVLARRLRGSAPEAVWLLEEIMRGARHHRPECLVVYECLLDPSRIVDRLAPEQLDAMLVVARAAGSVLCLAWLLAPTIVATAPQIDADRLLHQSLRETSLGHRRALARRARGPLLDRLLGDPDGVVIHNLLHNSHVQLRHVLAISSRRPTTAVALAAVLAATRWSRQYEVRLSLAQNPYLPQGTAMLLWPLLRHADLLAVADTCEAHGAARDLLEWLTAHSPGGEDGGQWGEHWPPG